jgi:hypothetical protein
MLTPMSKYYCSEMCMRVANDALQVLGGSGYMSDYPVERYLRDARITTIYEGTSQLQVVAAVRGVTSGSCDAIITELLDREWPAELTGAIEQIREGQKELAEAVEYVKKQGGSDYMELYGRKLVDMGIILLVAALFADHATASAPSTSLGAGRKKAVLHRWLASKMPELQANRQMITSGDKCVISDFETCVCPGCRRDDSRPAVSRYADHAAIQRLIQPHRQPAKCGRND